MLGEVYVYYSRVQSSRLISRIFAKMTHFCFSLSCLGEDRVGMIVKIPCLQLDLLPTMTQMRFDVDGKSEAFLSINFYLFLGAYQLRLVPKV